MSDGPIHNSSIPSLNAPKQSFTINGVSYPGLGMSTYHIGDDIAIVLKGTVKGLNKPEHGRGAINLEILIEEVKDATPRKDRDETNRLR